MTLVVKVARAEGDAAEQRAEQRRQPDGAARRRCRKPSTDSATASIWNDDQDRGAREAERAQRADLRGARLHRGVHRVRRAEAGADAGQHRDADHQDVERVRRLRLLGVVVGLALRLERVARVVVDAALERLEVGGGRRRAGARRSRGRCAWRRCASSRTSTHTSLSNDEPPASKMPTTFHVPRPNSQLAAELRRPRSGRARRGRRSPRARSGVNMRPSAICTSSWTASATGSTPRTSTFSRPPSLVRKNGCTTSSGETSGWSSRVARDAVEEADRLVRLERQLARAVVVRALAHHHQVQRVAGRDERALEARDEAEEQLHATTTSAITPTVMRLRAGPRAQVAHGCTEAAAGGHASEHLVQRLHDRLARRAPRRHDAGQHADEERQEDALDDHRRGDDEAAERAERVVPAGERRAARRSGPGEPARRRRRRRSTAPPPRRAAWRR